MCYSDLYMHRISTATPWWRYWYLNDGNKKLSFNPPPIWAVKKKKEKSALRIIKYWNVCVRINTKNIACKCVFMVVSKYVCTRWKWEKEKSHTHDTHSGCRISQEAEYYTDKKGILFPLFLKQKFCPSVKVEWAMIWNTKEKFNDKWEKLYLYVGA